MGNRKVGAVEKAFESQDAHDRFKSAGFRHRARVAPYVWNAAQTLNSFDRMVNVEPARGVRQNESRVRIMEGKPADAFLIHRIGHRSRAYHV